MTMPNSSAFPCSICKGACTHRSGRCAKCRGVKCVGCGAFVIPKDGRTSRRCWACEEEYRRGRRELGYREGAALG